jgi:RNA polymerase sigma factor (sigma-70 family)
MPPGDRRGEIVATVPRDLVLRLGRAGLLGDGGGLTDGQLLECFLAGRDEGAFEALLRRHGPMVLGVCRRVLRHEQDAEDAYQATFLVLARKAASVRPRDMVGNWLYGVAYHTALKARAAAARRRTKEREAAAMPRPQAADEVWRRLEPLLDQELSRLPDRYRVPIVLCDLEGKTRKEAARQLGWAEGTVASRLARGRGLLGQRLTRHGLALSGGAVAAALARVAAAAAPVAVPAGPLVKAAGLFAAGQAAPGVSARVAALTEGVLRAMLLSKLKIATAVVLTLALVGVGTTLYTQPAPAQDKTNPPGEAAPKAPEKRNPADPDPFKAPAAQPDEKAKDPPQDPARPKGGEPAGVLLRHVRLEEVNVQDSVISGFLTVGTGGRKPTELRNLPLARDAKVHLGAQAGKLSDLKPGAHVTLQLAVVQDQLLVIGIQAENRATEAKRDEDEKLARQKRAVLEAQFEAAKADLAAARAKVELARANVDVAAVALKFSQSAQEAEENRAELEVCRAKLKQAEAQLEAATARVKALGADLEKLKDKGVDPNDTKKDPFGKQ